MAPTKRLSVSAGEWGIVVLNDGVLFWIPVY